MRKYLVLLTLLPFTGFSQPNLISLIDRYMQESSIAKDFSGVILINQKDKVIYKKAFGLANREWNIPNTLETKFRIGSNTKQFTAAAILQLADQGALQLDDKLSKFFPGYPKGDSVTITMLLNHTSGIKNFSGPVFKAVETQPLTRDSVVALIRNIPYDFSPGTRWSYSNAAYFLAGYVIEKVTGKSYSEYLQESLLSKAGMRNSGVNNLDSVLQKRAMGYQKSKFGWRNARYISMEIPFSAGAMYSTAEDLYRWTKALFGNKMVSARHLQQMVTPALNNYGLGFRIDSFQNKKRIGHAGSIPGFEAYSAWFPEDELSFILLSNNESNVSAIAEHLEGIIYKAPPVRIDTLFLQTLAGTYVSADDRKFTFTVKGRSLRFMDGDEAIELYPISSNTFINGYARRRFFTFAKEAGDKIKLLLTINGLKSEWAKIEQARNLH